MVDTHNQSLTPFHAKYYAYEITKQGGKGVDRLSRSIFDACVDLNPHQIEAALFAMRSPLNKGVLIADEVGLGKTIEAGLVITQYWAERKRRILVISPASIRKQWAIELEEKFNLPSVVIDSKEYNQAVKQGVINPFDDKRIVIVSTHFASRKREDIKAIHWDTVIIDEAHKLRNAYRSSNKMGQNLRWALDGQKKILLTATPLQNSLLELYGLSMIIDERIFGDIKSFRSMYLNSSSDVKDLRERLQYFCHRTLRRQVTEYVRYTSRKLITRPFTPSENEQKLYEAITEYLQKENSYAMPEKHRHLTTLIVRKLLASSPPAVAGTLASMRDRLVKFKENLQEGDDDSFSLFEGEEFNEDDFEEFIEELEVEEEVSEAEVKKEDVENEIQELNHLINWASGIGVDSKSRALLTALEVGFQQISEMRAAPKAIIFTESRRTQRFLKDFLDANGYAGKVITFNGSNKEPYSTKVYEKWLAENENTGRISGSRQVNVRTAIIDNFRDEAQILIATEAAAEGINLQFCSLVINYDLPWNPQRIEQRIGRCHRYGQKFDVVVINFLNQRNEVDQRVYELLNSKFKLFSGVFGASDDVLGSIESGVDFEKRILDIYEQCRTPEQIEAAFCVLQEELDEKISTKLEATRRKLLENFDEDVHSRLKANLEGTRERLDQFSKMFWNLTQYIIRDDATFDNQKLSFHLHSSPLKKVKPGEYHLISKNGHNQTGDFLYRLSHPLGEYVLNEGKNQGSSIGAVRFDISNHPTRISVIEKLKGKSGWLNCKFLTIHSYDKEEYVLFSGFSENGEHIDQEVIEKMFGCFGNWKAETEIPAGVGAKLESNSSRHIDATIAMSLEENGRHFNEARERLEKWAEDMVTAAELELKQTKKQIKLLNREARLAPNIERQQEIQKEILALEKKKRKQRREIFELEDQIEEKRDALIDALEKQLSQKTECIDLFSIRWEVG
jgi:ERCC4-related helicase